MNHDGHPCVFVFICAVGWEGFSEHRVRLADCLIERSTGVHKNSLEPQDIVSELGACEND